MDLPFAAGIAVEKRDVPRAIGQAGIGRRRPERTRCVGKYRAIYGWIRTTLFHNRRQLMLIGQPPITVVSKGVALRGSQSVSPSE